MAQLARPNTVAHAMSLARISGSSSGRTRTFATVTRHWRIVLKARALIVISGAFKVPVGTDVHETAENGSVESAQATNVEMAIGARLCHLVCAREKARRWSSRYHDE